MDISKIKNKGSDAMDKGKRKNGITLIELIITLGLIGVITALVFSFFFSNKRTLDKVEVKADLQYEAKEVMNKISKYAMEAIEAKYQQGDSTLRFATVEDGDIVFTVKGGESNFNEQGRVIITGKEILFGDGSGDDKILSENLKNITVYGDKKKNITVELVLEKKDISYSVKDSFLFRNSKQ